MWGYVVSDMDESDLRLWVFVLPVATLSFDHPDEGAKRIEKKLL
jgi:hypothetical protein